MNGAATLNRYSVRVVNEACPLGFLARVQNIPIIATSKKQARRLAGKWCRDTFRKWGVGKAWLKERDVAAA